MQNLDVETLFAGERLCLDFVNTRCRRRDETLELLGSVAELGQWLGLARGVFGERLGPVDAEPGEAALAEALALRAALNDLVRGAMAGEPASASALEAVNAVLRANPSYTRLESGPAGFAVSRSVARPEREWLAAIAADAADLLSHGDLSLLKQCAHPTCVRVFYDTTKNHRRRWCAEKCGSHTKAAAYYRRKKARMEGENPGVRPDEEKARAGENPGRA